MAQGLSCSTACGDHPGPGTEHVSPALTGGFFASEPPGKPQAPFLSTVASVPQGPSRAPGEKGGCDLVEGQPQGRRTKLPRS